MTESDQVQTAYLAGGCFWGMEELLRAIPGVLATKVGYCGGNSPHPVYEQVRTGRTGHAETVKITFAPPQLGYRHLLFEFFRMHNPTTRHQQGNDIGSQYRSAIFYLDAEQRSIAEQVIDSVNASGEWHSPVVTELVPFEQFCRAEAYHQKYLLQHPEGYTCHFIRSLKLGE